MNNAYLLCIDDDEQVLESLARILGMKFSLPIYTAFDGQRALEMLEDLRTQAWEPAVVISDFMMPGMTGDEVLHQVHDRFPGAKTILLSGMAELKNLSKAVNQGGLYRYIPKPWELSDFLLTIQEALKSFQQDRLIEAQNEELRELNRTLEQRVETRTREIQKEINQRQKAEASVQSLNEVLKARIRELTLLNRLIHRLGRCRKFPEVRKVVQEEFSPIFDDVKVTLGLLSQKGLTLDLIEKDEGIPQKILLADQPFISYALENQQTLISGKEDGSPGFPDPGLVVVPFHTETGLRGCLLITLKETNPDVEILTLFETLGAMAAGSVEMIQTLAQEKVARLSAEEANKTKSRFLANMSHEIRTPMNAVLGFTQVLLNAEDIPEEHRENLKIIQSSGHHLLTLINEILDLSKIEAGKLVLKKKVFNLRDSLNQIRGLFELQSKERGIDFRMSVNDTLPALFLGDEAKVSQIIINLLSNSLRHTVQGEVSLDARPGERPGSVFITVADTGEGIAPEDQERIFEPFVVAESGRGDIGGTGLGLAISRRLVEAMGGRMSLQSQPGFGTIVSFYVKLALTAGAVTSNESSFSRVTGAEPEQTPKRILVVDDSHQNRHLLKEIFQRIRCEVKTTDSGESALNLVKDWAPDLAVLDMRMPGIDGRETAVRLRRLPGLEKLPVIGTSATPSSRRNSGVFDQFLYKPFKESDLYMAAESLLGIKLIFKSEVPIDVQDVSHRSADMLTPLALRALPIHWRRKLLEFLNTSGNEPSKELLLTLEPQWLPFKRALGEMLENQEEELLKDLLKKSL